jgi:hypothetical protein
MSDVSSRSTPRRDEVWPAPDWRARVQEGMEVRAAAMVKTVRDRVPASPPTGVRQLGTHYSQECVRAQDLVDADYMAMVSLMRRHLEACRTCADVKTARSTILEEAGWGERASAEARHRVTSVFRGKTDPMRLDYQDMARIEQMVSAGWPEPPVHGSWSRNHVVRSDGAGGHMVCKGLAVVEDGFATEADAWAWLRQQGGARMPPPAPPMRVTGPSIPVRREQEGPSSLPPGPLREGLPPPLLEVEGTHGLARAFGLAGVSFARSVPMPARAGIVQRAACALEDMARACFMEPAALGLGGVLVLRFCPPAEMEAPSSVPLLCMDTAAIQRGGIASDWATALTQWMGHSADNWLTPPAQDSRIAVGDTALQDALRAVEAAMWRADPVAWLEARTTEEQIAAQLREIAQAERQRDMFVARSRGQSLDAAGESYLRGVERWLSGRRGGVLPELERRLASASGRDHAAGASVFSAGRGPGSHAAQGMFATAFACTVNDALAARGGHNWSVVNGMEEGREGGEPMPRGVERQTMNKAIRNMLAVLGPCLGVGRRPGGGVQTCMPVTPDARPAAGRFG